MDREKKPDVRQQIENAFYEVLHVKPINKITVTDIMNAGGMTRQMFYHYFADVDELVFWIHQNKTWKYSENFYDGDTFVTVFERYMEELMKNRKFYMSIIKKESLNSFPNFFYRQMLENVEVYIKKYKRHTISEDEDFSIKLYWHGATDMLLDWIQDGMKTPPAVMAHRFYSCLPATLMRFYEE